MVAMQEPAYRLSLPQILELFGSDPDKGLNGEEAHKRHRRYGPNEITKRNSLNILQLLFEQFASPLVLILIFAGAFSFAVGETKDAVVIAVVILTNATIGFIQELQAARSIQGLSAMLKLKAKAIRDGKTHSLNSRELVPGDLITIEAGDKVPADVRLIKVHEASFDEAILTGESVPVAKQVEELHLDDPTYADQINMAFAGTLMTRGQATGIVSAIGDETAVGQISQSVDNVANDELPIQIKINRFARKIGLLTLAGSTLVFILGMVMGRDFVDIFRDVAAVMVAAVPEGLPIVVTITMAIGVKRMVKANSVIRSLPAVETLGSTTLIGTDKTGTLTKNQMTVTHIYADETLYEVTGEGYSLKGAVLKGDKKVTAAAETSLYHTLLIGSLCNESALEIKGKEPKVIGDPTEAALLVSAHKASLDVSKLKATHELLDLIPFESGRNYMATLHRIGKKEQILIKGSPEVIVKFCEPSQRKQVLRQAENLSAKGLRVLAMARKPVANLTKITEKNIDSRFEFCGLQAMIDPPRKEVIETIKKCHEAGIRVVMITGDHAITAAAIGKTVGITHEDNPQVVTGSELLDISDRQLDEVVKTVSIFARVSPQDKLRLVEAFKRNGEIVAVTGDGVNDAPALKSAHIGVAMGKGGTDVAREVADMVIIDDNFTSIVKAVEQGRIVFENIRKVALFLIPTGVSAIVTVLVTMMLGVPIPYTPIQLLWINLATNGLQDMALAFEPGDGDALKRKPYPITAGIMSTMMLWRSLLVGLVISMGVIGLYYGAIQNGMELAQARTLAVTTMVLFQFFHVWNARSETKSIFEMSPFSNPFLFASLGLAFSAQLAAVYLTPLQNIFGMRPLELSQWLLIFYVASSVIVVVELDKALRKASLSRLKAKEATTP